MGPRSRRVGLPLALSAVSVFAGQVLAAGATSRAPASAHAARLAVVERDFHIKTARSVAAGPVKLIVTNRGPDLHELIVVRFGRRGLPMNADGLTVNEDALEPVAVGALEPGAPGETRTLELHLRPGRYVMFCNMAGHELGGMETRLVAR